MLRNNTISPVTVYAILIFTFLFCTDAVIAQTAAGSSATIVEVAIDIHQIVEVNQKKKNFTAVISVRGSWNDPLLAYGEDSKQAIKTMDVRRFKQLVFEKGATYPASSVYNQQGGSQSQSDLITIHPNGDINFLRVQTITLQAPHFDFKHFPFDSQIFEIHLDSLLPETVYIFKDPIKRSSINTELGEEEWLITDFSSQIVHDNESTSFPSSRLTVTFTATRHNIYYILKVFIPIALILLVSWFSFFLQDYGKRIDLASSNLLIFIAFNFTIANELPKLGYITFLDYLLVSTFVITSIVILLNVKLKRMYSEGQQEKVQQIDKYVLWIYPLIYFIGLPLISILLLFIN